MLKGTNRNFFTIFDYTTYQYDPDGSQSRRKLYTGAGLQLDEQFEYSSWRGLSWKYTRTDPNLLSGSDTWEYRYRYNAMGEREQKRETLNPAGDDSAANGYSWSYYLLGGSREQLSLWEGLQTSDATFCSPPGAGSYVNLYPTEYLVYGVEYPGVKEDVPRLRLLPNNTQEYRITDHLASVRSTLNNSGTVTHTYDYEPFGDILSGGGEARQGFNSREKDQEVDLFNNGVRKLDDNEGRFTSIDPLWEKFRAWSPYQYGYNNPMAVTDPDGMQCRAGVDIGATGMAASAFTGEQPGDAGRTPTAEDIKTARLAQVRENFKEATEMSAYDYADGTQSNPSMEAWKATLGGIGVKASSEPITPGKASAKSDVHAATRPEGGGLDIGKEISDKQAIERLRTGKDTYTVSKKKAKSLMKKAKGSAFHEGEHGRGRAGFYNHYHDNQRAGGHSFYGKASEPNLNPNNL